MVLKEALPNNFLLPSLKPEIHPNLRKDHENGNILEAAQITESTVPGDRRRRSACCSKCSRLQRMQQIGFDL